MCWLTFFFQIAFIHFEGSAILTVQTHVITRNPRIRVSHDKHHTWYLHIDDVQKADAGTYLCQINSETAKTQSGYLHVVGKLSLYSQLAEKMYSNAISTKKMRLFSKFEKQNAFWNPIDEKTALDF